MPHSNTLAPARLKTWTPLTAFTSTVEIRLWLVAGFVGLVLAAHANSLQNDFVRADFGPRGLTNVTDLASGKTVAFNQDEFYVSVGGANFLSSSHSPTVVQQTATSRVYQFTDGQWTLSASYELEPGWRFVSKRILISTADTNAFVVHQVDMMRGGVATPIAAEQSVNSGLLLRLNNGAGTPVSRGIFVELQTAPQYAIVAFTNQQLTVSDSPGLVWNMSYGTYGSDRLLLGPYTLSGVTYPLNQIAEWQYLPDGTAPAGPWIDRAELDALAGCVRAFLLWQPTNTTRVAIGWCENDYQINAGTSAGRTEYKRILDQAAAVGCKDVLYTPANSLLSSLAANSDVWNFENVLWLCLGQQIRTNAWNPASNAVPASVQTMLNYAKSKNLKLMAYVYPSLPFGQNPAWTNWPGRFADSGQRSFQNWLLQKLSDFQTATGVGGYCFDYWLLGYDNAPSTPYAQWYGCRRVLEQLRRQSPNGIIDGRQRYQNYGAWTWLAGTYPHPLTGDEQPVSFQAFPDLHWDRVSADRQRHAAWWYRVDNFCPLEILPGYMTHQTPRQNAAGVVVRSAFRTRDWDYLGWRYSVMSSIGTAPFNDVVNFLPARDTNEFDAFSAADQQWMRGWFDWVDQNFKLLRNLHPILSQPQLGRVDGTAAFNADDHGFIFLFNPNYRALTARFTLGNCIGLTNGGPFIMRQLYPDAEKGKLIAPPNGAVWHLGDSVTLPMPGADALVLEITNAPSVTQPLLLGATGTATFNTGQLTLTKVVGQVGTHSDLRVLLPAGRSVTSATVNGVFAGFQQNSNIVSLSANFAGTPFPRLPQIGTYDPNFTGGVYSAHITIPSAVFQQLAARKKAWPVPYTVDDLKATWLGSYRLLLFVDVANPNPKMAVSLKIDGRPVTLTPAFMTIYNIGANNSFVGWYVDVSSLTPDVPHQFQLTLPPLAAGQFQGLFLDNVAAQFTKKIQFAGTAADDFNTPHNYLTDGTATAASIPGVVIDHLPASSGLYVGSPSLVIWTNGDYIASHDFFGPKSTENSAAVTAVFRSCDRGAIWQKVATIHGQFWSTLFVNHGALYLMGPDRQYGDVVIRRSLDGGTTWTTPTDAMTGQLRTHAEYHTAPTPVIEHDGRLWRAFEQRNPPWGWGVNFRAGMFSAPVDADLLVATNWTTSNFLPRDPHWLDGKFNAWLEGNAVVAPDGNIVDVLRVDKPNLPEKAALVQISADGRKATFNPQNGFVDFPGGATKFTIRFDPESRLYWSLANIIPPNKKFTGPPGARRNTLALVSSPDLRHWTVRRVVLHHAHPAKVGFQYADWQFDGDDIIAVCRTAFADGLGGANSFHNANFLTFYRWKNFRSLAMPDARTAVSVPASAYTNHAKWRDGKPVALTGVARPSVEKTFVYRPTTNAWTYSHHPELAFFKGRYFAGWSNGQRDEDAPGQRVMFSTSRDFIHWSAPRPLVDSVQDANGVERVLTAAGFYVHDGTLVAYFANYGPHKENTHLEAVTTTDGEHWGAVREIGLPVCPNYGPRRLASGRLLISGNISFPWSDDPTGLAGWHIGGIYPADMSTKLQDNPATFWGVAKKQGWPTALCEGSFFQTGDGVIHMFLRATGAHAPQRLWLTDSADNAETWSPPRPTDFSNDDSKFQFGRLPDGRFFYLGNPLAGDRLPLVLSLSRDGVNFNRHFILGDGHYKMRYPGRYKDGEYGYPHAIIHDGYFNVIVSRQKEAVQVLRVKLADLK